MYVFTGCNEHTRIGIFVLIVLNHMIRFHWKVHFEIIAKKKVFLTEQLIEGLVFDWFSLISLCFVYLYCTYSTIKRKPNNHFFLLFCVIWLEFDLLFVEIKYFGWKELIRLMKSNQLPFSIKVIPINGIHKFCMRYYTSCLIVILITFGVPLWTWCFIIAGMLLVRKTFNFLLA